MASYLADRKAASTAGSMVVMTAASWAASWAALRAALWAAKWAVCSAVCLAAYSVDSMAAEKADARAGYLVDK